MHRSLDPPFWNVSNFSPQKRSVFWVGFGRRTNEKTQMEDSGTKLGSYWLPNSAEVQEPIKPWMTRACQGLPIGPRSLLLILPTWAVWEDGPQTFPNPAKKEIPKQKLWGPGYLPEGPVGEILEKPEKIWFQWIFQHPGTYPRPPSKSLWRNSFLILWGERECLGYVNLNINKSQIRIWMVGSGRTWPTS